MPPVGPNKTLRHLSKDRGSIRGCKYNLRRKVLLMQSSYQNVNYAYKIKNLIIRKY